MRFLVHMVVAARVIAYRDYNEASTVVACQQDGHNV